MPYIWHLRAHYPDCIRFVRRNHTSEFVTILTIIKTRRSVAPLVRHFAMKKNISYLTAAGAIAAVYVILCIVLRPLSFSAVQVRAAEALCVLPYFTSAAVPGLAVGCFLANILGGADIPDIIFGTVATLLGAFGSLCLRKHKYLVSLPPIIANTVILPFIFRFTYGEATPLWLLAGSIGLGEVLSAGVLGTLLLLLLEKYRNRIF